jgi:hypothetical protein
METFFQVYSFILPFLPQLEAIPYVGKVASILVMVFTTVIACAAGLGSVATALVGIWHSFAVLAQGLAILPIPGFKKLQPIADKMKADETKITSLKDGKILPILNRLSSLPLPKKAAAIVPIDSVK